MQSPNDPRARPVQVRNPPLAYLFSFPIAKSQGPADAASERRVTGEQIALAE